MSVRTRTLAGVLAICSLALVSGCGGASLKSAKADPHAVVHDYPAEGFSLAYGPQWQASVQAATAQTAWQLELTQPYTSSSVTSEVMISIGVQPEHKYRDPRVFQSKYEQLLTEMGGTPQSVTLSGVPAVFWKGLTGYSVALASGGRSYLLAGTIPSGGDTKEAPQVLAVLNSLKLPGSPAAGS
jgi:hypothetical protein